LSSSDADLQGHVGWNSPLVPLAQMNEPVANREVADFYDFAGALEFLEGDETLLYSLFQIFLDTAPHLIQGMQDAMASEDRQGFQGHVHQLKGALYALNALHQAKAAERLETEVSVGLFSELEPCVRWMEHEVAELMILFRDTLLVRSKK